MNYTVYDITEDSPSLKERDIIWSVLLFADKVEITSNMAFPFIMYGEFPRYKEEQKFVVYEMFRPMIEQLTTWHEFETQLKFIQQQRRKKNKTGLEVKDLANREVWLRKTEKWFMVSLYDNLAKYNYDEIVPLTMQYVNDQWPDVLMRAAMTKLVTDDEMGTRQHFIKIVTNSLSRQDNIFVFDERIEPFVIKRPIDEYNGQELMQDGKPLVYSEKILNMPLCYTLKADEIKMARNELTKAFHEFHEGIYKITKGDEDFQTGINKIRALLPDMQNKIDSNSLITKAKNQKADLETVAIHLAYTSNKGILTMLQQLGMLNEEQYLQAGDLVIKESNLDNLHPFMYITHE